MEVNEDIARINFDEPCRSSLNYYIVGSGLHITKGNGKISFEVINSQGRLTPGFIQIPQKALPELIADLIRLNNNTHE